MHRRGKYSSISCGATATTQVAFADPHRRALLIGTLSGQGVYLQFGQKTGASTGIFLNTQQSHLLLDWATFGDLVTWDVFAYNPGAVSLNIGVLEAFEP